MGKSSWNWNSEPFCCLFFLSQLLPCLFISRIQRALLNCYSVGCYSDGFSFIFNLLVGEREKATRREEKRRGERDSRMQPNNEMSGERNGKVIGKVGLLSIRTSHFPPNYVTATLVTGRRYILWVGEEGDGFENTSQFIPSFRAFPPSSLPVRPPRPLNPFSVPKCCPGKSWATATRVRPKVNSVCSLAWRLWCHRWR